MREEGLQKVRAIRGMADVEGILEGSPDIRQLHAVWRHRRRKDSGRLRKNVNVDSAVQIPWSDDPDLAHQFVRKAFDAQEYLLAIDAAREFLSDWRDHEAAGLNRVVEIRTCYAAALTRLGFTRRAYRELKEFVAAPVGRKLQSKICLQIGRTLLEESQGADLEFRRFEAAQQAFLFLERAAGLSSEPLETLSLAACAGLISGKTALASHTKRLARSVLDQLESVREDMRQNYGTVLAEARAYAAVGEFAAARRSFEKLQLLKDVTTVGLAEARHEARFLAEAMGESRNLFDDLFPGLELLVFAGHVPDRPGEAIRFPPGSIAEVRAALAEALGRYKSPVGLTCGCPGADLLFTEALLDRGGALHLVLPWAVDEFVKTSVAPYDPAGTTMWQDFFKRAHENAATLREIGHFDGPSSAVGWEFLMEVTAGLALQTARALRLDVHPVAVWDGKRGRGPGGTEAFIRYWRHSLKSGPELIPLPDPGSFAAPGLSTHGITRCERPILHQEVKSMLFGDIVGYSRLPETATREFIGLFLNGLGSLVSTSRHAPCSVNTWGDAIYAVFDFAQDAGLFALELAEMVEAQSMSWLKQGLGWSSRNEDGMTERHPIDIRIGLHTGPVTVHFDPVVRRLGFTGANVSRAARIEPIAEPGQVFASEEFAAMAELDGEFDRLGTSGRPETGIVIVCEYAGTMPLAKNYPGLHRIYRVRARRNLLIEQLARAIHAQYCEDTMRRGETSEINSSLRPWDELSEDLKEANRAVAADVPNKLREIGWEMVAVGGLNALEVTFAPEQIERLAVREHNRWKEERQQRDWTYAPVRNNALKQHPSIIPWEHLSPVDQEKDRSTVKILPRLAHGAGFRMKRIDSR